MTPTVKHIRAILTTEGFIRYFFQMIRDNPAITQTDAYEKTEKEYEEITGRRKYSGFDSFRQIKKRYLRKK
jgi:hypothetical protein